MTGKKAILTICICLFVFFPLYGEVERIKIAVMDLQALSGYEKGQAEQLTELLKNDLINNTRFTVIDKDTLPVEQWLRFENCTDIDCALEIGAVLGTDYVLVGSVGRVSGKTAITVLLVNVISAKKVLAEESAVRDDKVLDELSVLAGKVTNSAVMITRVTLRDIRDYIRRERFSEARRYLEFYIDRNGEDRETRDLTKVIDRELAAVKYDQSKELFESYLFEDAHRLISEALTLDEGNPVYLEMREKIEEEAEKQREMKDTQILDEAEGLISVENYRAAASLLEIYRKQEGEETPRLTKLQSRVERGIAADDYYTKAKRALNRREFEAAQLAINEALKLLPEKNEYIVFTDKLKAEKARFERSQETWEKYREEITTIDFLSIFAVRKDVKNFLHLTFASHTFKYRDRTSLEEDRYRFSGLEANFMYHLLEPFSLNLSFLDFYITLFGNLGFGVSNNETVRSLVSESGTTEYTVIDLDNMFYFDINGGGGLTTALFAYSLGFGVEVSTGFLRNNRVNEIVLYGERSNYATTYYLLGIGFDVWFGWNPTDKLQLLIKGRFNYPLVLGVDHVMDRRRLNEFSIGLGYRLF
jgi:TolB-like protein